MAYTGKEKKIIEAIANELARGGVDDDYIATYRGQFTDEVFGRQAIADFAARVLPTIDTDIAALQAEIDTRKATINQLNKRKTLITS